MDLKFKHHRPFGPSILEVKIPEETVAALNNYIDEIVANENKSLELDHGKNLVGDVTQEFRLEKEIMLKSGWTKFLAKSVAKWIEFDNGDKIKNFALISSWIVRQFKNEYNPTHWHSGHISGAGFLKVPNTFGNHKQEVKKETKGYNGGSLQLIHGSRMFLSPSTFTIKPEVGSFYFFPHYLMHTVFPFKGTDEERRSISFNAEIDKDIYNVYGK